MSVRVVSQGVFHYKLNRCLASCGVGIAGNRLKCKSFSALVLGSQVPVLVDSGLVIWDSLAIVEYLAERFPDQHLWPQQPNARALARSLCAEMHSGFAALRAACPMNIEATLPDIGALMLRDRPAVRNDLARIDHMWSSLLTRFGGPMLFGRYSVADAFFAPVVMRIKTYHLPLSEVAGGYVQTCLGTSGVEAWVSDALAENDFRDFEEPYRLKVRREISQREAFDRQRGQGTVLDGRH